MTRSNLLLVLLCALSLLSGGVCLAAPLKVACYPDYVPYASFNDTGEAEGVLIDVWRLWSEKTGVSITFIPKSLNNGVAAIEAEQADVHCGLFYSDARAEQLAFSDALIRTQSILFARAPNFEKSIRGLKSPIAVVEGDFAIQFLKQHHPAAGLRVLSSYRALLDGVAKKEPDAFIYDYPRSFPGYRPLPPPPGYTALEVLYTERLRAAVKRGNAALVEKINSGLSKISDEEFWELASKWNLYKKDNTALYLAVGVSLVMLLLAGVYIRKLRSRLKRARGAEREWSAIINGGESDLVEFKSSLRWDLKQERVNKALEHVIAKTISAFLNADGGHLFIGVDDTGSVIGLEKDYQSFSKKPNADGFLLGLSAVINNMIGKKFHRFISASIVTAEGKDICIIAILPADGPAFLLSGDKEEFYIRTQASSQPLGLKETHEYIVSKWPPK